MKFLIIFLIWVYQKLFSLDHGIPGKIFPNQRICIFHPSCSEYSALAIRKYGSIWGSYIAIKRIIRCHPSNVGGDDPIPSYTKDTIWLKLLSKI